MKSFKLIALASLFALSACGDDAEAGEEEAAE